MTFEQLLPWIVGLQAIITFGTTAYTLLSSRATKALAEIDKVRADVKAEIDKVRLDTEKVRDSVKLVGEASVGRISLAESRLLKIESEMAHLPDRDQTHRLEVAVERLNGQIAMMDERLKPVASISDRLQDFLLDQAARK